MLLVKYHFIYISSWRYNKKKYSKKRGDMQLSHRLSNCLRLISAPVFLQIYAYNVLWSCSVVIYVYIYIYATFQHYFHAWLMALMMQKIVCKELEVHLFRVSRWIKLHNSLSVPFIKIKSSHFICKKFTQPFTHASTKILQYFVKYTGLNITFPNKILN